MKRALAVGLLMLLFGASLFAQPQEKQIYAKSVPIVKIYTHQLGYKIYYIEQNSDIGYFYVPVSWFIGAGSRGSIIWGLKPEHPYFSIYWEDGKFSYIKLFLGRNLREDSWGVLTDAPSLIKDKFEIEELVLEF